LEALQRDIPEAWLTAARMVVPLTSRGRVGVVMEEDEVAAMILQRVG
jgi:hypothetical protein